MIKDFYQKSKVLILCMSVTLAGCVTSSPEKQVVKLPIGGCTIANGKNLSAEAIQNIDQICQQADVYTRRTKLASNPDLSGFSDDEIRSFSSAECADQKLQTQMASVSNCTQEIWPSNPVLPPVKHAYPWTQYLNLGDFDQALTAAEDLLGKAPSRVKELEARAIISDLLYHGLTTRGIQYQELGYVDIQDSSWVEIFNAYRAHYFDLKVSVDSLEPSQLEPKLDDKLTYAITELFSSPSSSEDRAGESLKPYYQAWLRYYWPTLYADFGPGVGQPADLLSHVNKENYPPAQLLEKVVIRQMDSEGAESDYGLMEYPEAAYLSAVSLIKDKIVNVGLSRELVLAMAVEKGHAKASSRYVAKHYENGDCEWFSSNWRLFEKGINSLEVSPVIDNYGRPVDQIDLLYDRKEKMKQKCRQFRGKEANA